ncbi:MAG: tetratricopeptide repeat protein [Firmicutes bacterium]|nr:tetratricopeptide repeat protein [Bacillota bacterium]
MDINNFYYRVDRLFEEKKAAEAEQFMKDTLAQAEAECDAGAIITVCNELGGYYRAASRYSEGIELYEKALRIMREMGLAASEHYGTTLVNYATMYTMAGDIVRALNLYTEAAEIYAAAGLGGDYRLAALFNNMSYICQDLEDYPQAQEYLEKALFILRSQPDSDIEIAVTNTNLASVYLAMGMIGEAKVTIKKAMDIFITESGNNDVHYAGAVCTLGEIYFKEGAFDKACALFKEGLNLTERDYGSDTLSYAVLCSNTAECLKEMGRAEEAAEYSAIAAVIRERIGL